MGPRWVLVCVLPHSRRLTLDGPLPAAGLVWRVEMAVTDSHGGLSESNGLTYLKGPQSGAGTWQVLNICGFLLPEYSEPCECRGTFPQASCLWIRAVSHRGAAWLWLPVSQPHSTVSAGKACGGRSTESRMVGHVMYAFGPRWMRD